MSIKRRGEQLLMEIILGIATKDERIRAVVLSGSRTNSRLKKDIFQDFDIVYVVNEVSPFVDDRTWLMPFGDILIMQIPDSIDGIWPTDKTKFTYLMQFTDTNRVDLTLLTKDRLSLISEDSQSHVLLDKDGLLQHLNPSSDTGYLPKPPNNKEFADCCNEFLWLSLYVAKGICRKQLPYAKWAFEQGIREELIKLFTWYIGIKTNFAVNIGAHAKYLEQLVEPALWQEFVKTYVDANYTAMWQALEIMGKIFNELAIAIAQHYGYSYNNQEYQAVMNYLAEIKKLSNIES